MPLQNRVLPSGEIVATPARGLLTGNRGILHRPDGTLGVSRWQHPHWVCCQLEFRGRYHGVMPDRGWTALFFLDEAVALAAGHRPCHFCRHDDAMRFKSAWARAHGIAASAPQMDRVLHRARVGRDRRQICHQAEAALLPNGSFVQWQEGAALLWEGALLPFDPAGYTTALPRPDGALTVLTPKPIVAVLSAGYAPELHPTARVAMGLQ